MSAGLDVAREALAGTRSWLVGGATRDRLLGRATTDVDVVVDGDPAVAARAIARAARGAACFALSQEFGSWRVVAREHAWQVDVEPLRGETIETDLELRDFTVNAIAEPIEGGALIDPLGGAADLRARRLRVAGSSAFSDDPLRVLRLVRLAVELDLEPDPETIRNAGLHAPALDGVSAERVFVELRRIIAARAARRGLDLMDQLGATAIVLPELDALRGIEQNRFHHLDVYGHTLEVFDRAVELTSATTDTPGADAELDACISPHRAEIELLLAEPLADELTRGEALRWGALLHDAAKPLTREVSPADGRVTFIAHDVRGAQLAREVLTRLRASERLRAHVACARAPPPAPRLSRPRAPATGAQNRVRVPSRNRAGRGRRDAAVDRRQARDAWRARRAGRTGSPEACRGNARRDAALAPARAAGPAAQRR